MDITLYSFQFIRKRMLETWHVVAISEQRARELLQAQQSVSEFKGIATSTQVIVDETIGGLLIDNRNIRT